MIDRSAVSLKRLEQLCRRYSALSQDDVEIIHRMAADLQLIADLAQADVFIDCPTTDPDVAIVVAEASPSTARSLYRWSVVGQPALKENEPAVIQTIRTGQPTLGIRGVTQEGVPVRQTVVPIKNPADEIIGTLIMEQDITQQVRQEEQVEILAETAEQLTETLLQAAVEGGTLPTLMPDALVTVNPQGRITYANLVAHQIAERVGLPLDSDEEDFLKSFSGQPVLERVMQERGFFSQEVQIRDWVFLVKAVALFRRERIARATEKVVGALILIRDITEIRAKEKELMVKSAVIQEIHHRVKNNLQTIASLLKLQMRRTSSEVMRAGFEESISRILSIAVVHEVLSKNGLELIDIKETIQQIAGIVTQNMVDPSQALEIALSGPAVILPSEQATSVALIVNELIQNAVGHAFKGRQGGIIEVRITDAPAEVAISVIDDGVGFGEIPPGGFGSLGLQIVDTLVREDLRGRFEIASDKGTEARFRFPKKGSYVQGGAANQKGPLRQLRIVIADDEPITRMDLREMLHEAGHLVVGEAGDGESALNLARIHRPDLVLLDIKMPGMEGFEAARRIQEERLAPIFLLTAYSQTEQVERAKEAGVLGYLVKPVREADLLPMVEVVVARHRETQGLEEEVSKLRDTLETRKAVEKAKGILMELHGYSEATAFRIIQQWSMERRSPLRQVAEGIITTAAMQGPSKKGRKPGKEFTPMGGE